MVANLGYGALVITFLVSLYGIGAAYYGARKKDHAWIASARNAMLLTFPLATVAALSIVYLLVTNAYEVGLCSQRDQQQYAFLLKGDRVVGWASRFARILVLVVNGFYLRSHPA